MVSGYVSWLLLSVELIHLVCVVKVSKLMCDLGKACTCEKMHVCGGGGGGECSHELTVPR